MSDHDDGNANINLVQQVNEWDVEQWRYDGPNINPVIELKAKLDDERALADDLATEVKHLRYIIADDHGHAQGPPPPKPEGDVLARYRKAREQ